MTSTAQAMVRIQQQQTVEPGRIASWELDLEATGACAGWTAKDPELVGAELTRLFAAFPTFIGAVGVPLAEGRCWVDAAEPLLSPCCDDLVVFNGGTVCVRCQAPVPIPDRILLGAVGRIPALLSGRPLELDLQGRMERLRAAGDPRAELYARSVLEVGERRYLAPRFGFWFTTAWPRTEPLVMVWPEYFEMLGILADHVYYADPYYRLCLYASWREQSAAAVLQSRVVPRLLIDMMVADLRACGNLQRALEQLDCSLYELYNLVGRPDQARSFHRVYERLLRR